MYLLQILVVRDFSQKKKTGEIRRPQGDPQAVVQAAAQLVAQAAEREAAQRAQRRAAPQVAAPQAAELPAVEPEPPYRAGENVECLVDDPNTGTRVWSPAVIREQDHDILSSFVIANEETRRLVERRRTDVDSYTGPPASNWIRIGDTVLYDEPRVRGIVRDKAYFVSYTNTRGERILTEKKTGEIRRPQGQPQTAAQRRAATRAIMQGIIREQDEREAVVPPLAVPRAAAQRVVRPRAQAPPPTPIGPGGVAFEIHNAFDNFKFDKFMDIVRKNSNFKNRDAPLKPLIDNINANPNLSSEKKTELSGKIERIFTTLRQYSNYDRNINNIMDCIQYVLMQPQDFIDIYIDTFVTDCLKAYSTGRGDSCIKGMYERVYFAFRDTVSTICLDQIQGTGAAPLCKPEYIEIFNCFYEDMPTEMLNDYAQQWFQERGEAAGNFSEENRIEDFVSFVRSKVNNVARFRQAERSVRRYAATNINVLFGGRQRRSKQLTKKRKSNQAKKTRRH